MHELYFQNNGRKIKLRQKITYKGKQSRGERQEPSLNIYLYIYSFGLETKGTLNIIENLNLISEK